MTKRKASQVFLTNESECPIKVLLEKMYNKVQDKERKRHGLHPKSFRDRASREMTLTTHGGRLTENKQ
jgi:hypothetical protein